MLVFAALKVLPGDPASGSSAATRRRPRERELTQRMDLDRPATTRYFDWLGGFVHGDLGDSAVSLAQGQRGVGLEPDLGPLTNSAILAAITALLMIPLSLVLGVLGAIARQAGRPRRSRSARSRSSRCPSS